MPTTTTNFTYVTNTDGSVVTIMDIKMHVDAADVLVGKKPDGSKDVIILNNNGLFKDVPTNATFSIGRLEYAAQTPHPTW